MGILYISSDLEFLATRLADEVDRTARDGDCFTPARIVVPNRYLRKWLRLHLARSLGIAANLSFGTLENALWDLLVKTDPNQTARPPESLDDNTYCLMALSVLLEDHERELATIERYLQCDGSSLSRLSCRRAWQLADRFGQLIRDYEYARQDALIQRWLKGESGLSDAGAFHKSMERAQRAIFAAITKEFKGKRALLNEGAIKNYKTFPQYAMERMLSREAPLRPGGVIHFFGFTEICVLHGRALAWLSKCFDLRVYHWNVLASQFTSSIAELAHRFHESNETPAAGDECALLHQWGRAGAESLELLAPLVDAGFEVEPLDAARPATARRKGTVLDRLREHLLGSPAAKTQLQQDTSLQIIACPGVTREVQTVYDSIVTNLQRDPSLRQTDIGVLTTDMATYRAALQAVFERGADQLHYNMVDFNAAGTSTFAQAVLGMLDLALETFARTRVFSVLLNPCFLARLAVNRAEAMTWLNWASSLGIYHGWDADEKAEHGYARSSRYSWKLGLQRLRLGRYMDITDENADGPAMRFGDVIPFADVESMDRERLDAFCRAVEGLLPALAQMRNARWSGTRWAEVLHRLINEFLDVPPDRPEEAKARAHVLAALEKLKAWDFLRDSESRHAALPLALVREFVHAQFKSLPGNLGEFLIGGVTIAELQPMRPLPFAIVYVLGLNEALFPGSNMLSSFDLRSAERLPGDIRPAEARKYDFLNAVVSARQKLYLLYNNRDLQRDQEILPSTPLLQLKRFLDDRVLTEAFQEVAMPFGAHDESFLDAARQPAYQDVFAQPHMADRVAAILEAQQTGRLKLNADQATEWQRAQRLGHKTFTIPADAEAPGARAELVNLRDLQRFLMLPAAESLRRHLRVGDDYETSLDEHEPLISSPFVGSDLVRQTLSQIIVAAALTDVDAAISGWRDRFAQLYADARSRSRTPESAFGEIDEAALVGDLARRLQGQGGLEKFLREHAACTYCGPILIGESLTPLGARLRFPALRLCLGYELAASATEIRIVGSTPFAWHSRDRFEILVLANSNKIRGDRLDYSMIEPALFHLALLANAESAAGERSSQAWLKEREYVLHVAHRGGIQTWTYPAGAITAAEALAYLTDLTSDLLRPDQFDLLPFALLATHGLGPTLQERMREPISAEAYYAALCEAIEDDRESMRPAAHIPLVVDVVQATVPEDALAKVRRRFCLLDRGPAHVRSQEEPSPW